MYKMKPLIYSLFSGCAHCKRFKSDFVRAADVLTAKGSTAKLAAVDGDQAKKLMSKYNVTGFPTLLYFK